MPAILTNTTLASDLGANDVQLVVASATGISVGDRLLVGQELCDVIATPIGTRIPVMRGVDGTRAVKHNTGAIVNRGAKNDFVLSRGGKMAVAGYTGELGEMELPLGQIYIDLDTGSIYELVDAGATFINGEWVVIDGSGLATQLAIGSKGKVGIVTETSGGSDQYMWVLRRGTYASALFDSDVTTAMELGAAAGFAAPYDSTNHVKIERATCIVAPSTATSPTVGDGVGTAYIDFPWVSGVATFVS